MICSVIAEFVAECPEAEATIREVLREDAAHDSAAACILLALDTYHVEKAERAEIDRAARAIVAQVPAGLLTVPA